MQNFTKQFPSLTKKLVYLDSAATTQTCEAALKAMDDYYKNYRANIHRGMYDSAIKATEAYETARNQVATFINAKREEIIFTSGTTHALNQLAYSLSPRLSHRDNIVLTRLEHHANLVPWQQMAKHYGFEIRFIELKQPIILNEAKRREKSLSQQPTGQRSLAALKMTNEYELDLESAKKLIDANTKIVSFSLVSNVLGCVAPAKEIIKLAKTYRALTIIDAAQAVAHLPIDVTKLDCDFLAFSGHKVYGPTGIGVLYGKKEKLSEHLEPFFFGGEMVSEVTYETATWNELPYKFEAGTPNIAGAIGLGAAVAWIKKVGFKTIQQHEKEVMNYALKKLCNEVTIVGYHSERREESLKHSKGKGSFVSTQDDKTIGNKNRISVIAFTIPGIHPHDIAEILNQDKVCIRAGHHCAEPLHKHLGLNASARLSVGIYSTKKDIDVLIKGIKKVKKLFA